MPMIMMLMLAAPPSLVSRADARACVAEQLELFMDLCGEGDEDTVPECMTESALECLEELP